MNKKKLTYSVSRRLSEGGYIIDSLRIGEYSLESTKESLDGAVDNKAGYGTAEAARRMEEAFAKLQADGHDTYFDTCLSERSFSMDFQVYENPEAERPHYCCTARLELPSKLSAAKWALALVEKIGRTVEKMKAAERHKDDPHPSQGFHAEARPVSEQSIAQLQDVVAALDKMGLVRVERWKESNNWAARSYWVAAAQR